MSNWPYTSSVTVMLKFLDWTIIMRHMVINSLVNINTSLCLEPAVIRGEEAACFIVCYARTMVYKHRLYCTTCPAYMMLLPLRSSLTAGLGTAFSPYFHPCFTIALMFLANVNSRSRSLYAIARPSVCRLLSVVCRLSVTFVRPTQAIEIFGNISAALGTLAIH